MERLERNEMWLQWAVELQSLAQAGLHYAENPFDLERYQRIREISAEMLANQSEFPVEKVKELFCSETGYQTPKVDTRAAVFKDGKIILVQENDGRWSLPGGWVEVHKSVKENAVKEVKEEAGLDVSADFVIAIQDRDKHNLPPYAWKVCKTFIRCTVLGGSFQPNTETKGSGYFALEELPELAEEKNTKEQVAMCFAAEQAEHWETWFD